MDQLSLEVPKSSAGNPLVDGLKKLKQIKEMYFRSVYQGCLDFENGWVMSAIAAGNDVCLKAELQRRHDPNVSYKGVDPVLLSVLVPDPCCLKLLIKYKAYIKHYYNGGNTLLHFAAVNDDVGCFRLLVDKLDWNERNEDGLSPADVAGPKCKKYMAG